MKGWRCELWCRTGHNFPEGWNAGKTIALIVATTVRRPIAISSDANPRDDKRSITTIGNGSVTSLRAARRVSTS
jgi:hypothetical protein